MLSATAQAPRSAYVHIPFCRRRCFYCDFPISVIGQRRRGETSGTIAQYVDGLVQEIRATPRLNAAPLQTVFFGGGTPSLLSTDQLAQILQALDNRFGIAAPAEISMEMDPGTFDLSHIQGYRRLGVSRVSLGVQAFQDELLAACGRFHRTADVYQAVELLEQASVPSVSLDLISGLPHQSWADWVDSLERAIALSPQHLSVYDLTIEPQTPFGRSLQPGARPLPTEAATVAMYRQAQRQLTAAGYDHYEISNYAQPGHRCQHNLTYWNNQPFYGFGMGAASYTQHQRLSRPRTLRLYREWVAAYVAGGGILDCPHTPPWEQVLDGLMVGLRLAEGMGLRSVAAVYGWAGLELLQDCLRPYIEKGWLVLDNAGQNAGELIPSTRLRLTDPEGFLMSNQVIADMFNALTPVAPTV